MYRLFSLFAMLFCVSFVAAEPATPPAAPETPPAEAPADGPDVAVDGDEGVTDDQGDAQAAMVEGKIYKSWTAYGNGTSVTTRTTITMGANTVTADAITVMDSKDEKEAKLTSDITMQQNGQSQKLAPQPGTEYAQVPQGQEYAPEGFTINATEAGKEQLTINGQTYDCRIYDFDGESPFGPIKGKMWVNDDVPGAHVKLTFDVQNGMSWESTLVSFEKK